MQSIDYLKNLERIIADLELQGIHKILQDMLLTPNDRAIGNNEKVVLPKLLLETQGKFQNLIKDPEIMRTANSIMLADFYNAKTISTMITLVNSVVNIDEIRNNRKHLPVFYSVYIRIDILLNLYKSLTELFFHEKMPDMDDSLATIEIEIADFQKDGMPLNVVIEMLSSTQKIYDAISNVIQVKHSNIRIAFFDSGSGLNISFVGVADVIKELRLSMIEFWERVKFLKFDENKKEIDAIKDTLSITKMLTEQISGGILTNEDGKRIKRIVIENLSALVKNGALLKELSSETTPYQNKELLLEKRAVPLLEPGNEAMPAPPKDSEESGEKPSKALE